jgi:hypothetical protein
MTLELLTALEGMNARSLTYFSFFWEITDSDCGVLNISKAWLPFSVGTSQQKNTRIINNYNHFLFFSYFVSGIYLKVEYIFIETGIFDRNSWEKMK